MTQGLHATGFPVDLDVLAGLDNAGSLYIAIAKVFAEHRHTRGDSRNRGLVDDDEKVGE